MQKCYRSANSCSLELFQHGRRSGDPREQIVKTQETNPGVRPNNSCSTSFQPQKALQNDSCFISSSIRLLLISSTISYGQPSPSPATMDTYQLNLAGLLGLCAALFAAQRVINPQEKSSGKSPPTSKNQDVSSAEASQWPFLVVYTLVMGSDWLQAS